MKWTRDPNRQIFADDTKARIKSHETRELRLAMKSENEIQTGNVMKAKLFVCYHVTVLYFFYYIAVSHRDWELPNSRI